MLYSPVPSFDRKLAMMAPGAWMTVLGMKHPALSKVLIPRPNLVP